MVSVVDEFSESICVYRTERSEFNECVNLGCPKCVGALAVAVRSARLPGWFLLMLDFSLV